MTGLYYFILILLTTTLGDLPMVTLVQMRKEAKGESHSQSPESGVQAWLQGARLEPLQHRAPWVGARSRDSTGLHPIQLFRGLP